MVERLLFGILESYDTVDWNCSGCAISCQVVCDLMMELQDSCHLSCFSETGNPDAFNYSVTQVKDKLLEDRY